MSTTSTRTGRVIAPAKIVENKKKRGRPMPRTPIPEVKKMDAEEEHYLATRRVNSMHQSFMREVVVPSRKGKL